MPRLWSADFRAGVEAPASDEPVLVLLEITAGDDVVRVAGDWGTVAGSPIEYRYFDRRYLGFPIRRLEVLTDEDSPPRGHLAIPDVRRRIGPAIQALAGVPLLDITILALNDFDTSVNPRVPAGTVPGTAEALGSASVGVGSGSVGSLTFAHEVAPGEQRILMVGVSLRQASGTPSADTVTYAGQALTKLSDRAQNNARAELWYLLDPPVGSADVVITLTASDHIVAGAQTYGGVDQGTPLGTAATAGHHSGSLVSSLSVNVDSGAGETVFDVLAREDGRNEPVPDAGQVTRWSQQSISAPLQSRVWGTASQKVGEAGTTAMGWSWDNDSRAAALIGVALKGAPVPDVEIIYRATGLTLRNIRADAMELTADITSFDDLTEPWPGVRATQARLPGLFR